MKDPDKPLSLLQTLMSVLASFFGVQSSRNRERDFTRGKPWHFVVIAVVATLGLVLIVALIVKAVLRSAGV